MSHRYPSAPVRPTAALLALLFLALLLTPPAAAAEATSLLRITGAGALQESPFEAAVESRRVEVAADALDAAPAELAIELLDGESYLARLDSLERRGPGDLAWRGHLAGDPEAQVSLTLKNGYVLGLVYAPEGVHELRTTPDGGQELARLDQRLFPGCANGADTSTAAGPAPRTPPPTMLGPAGKNGAAADTASEITVMTLYTPQARDAAGGVAAIEATVQAAIDDSNTSFINSDMTTRFNLVHTQLADYDDTGDIFTDRNWLQSDPDVLTLRNLHDADLVSMIVNASSFCGVAFLLGTEDPASFSEFAFQITVRACAVGNHSFTHEHGHNMGMQHNPENGAPVSSASFPWSYGHYVNGSYRTVMSYSSPCLLGCTRVNQISNPSVSFAGQPTGIAETRDNHRTGEAIAPFTANYRTSLSPVFDDGFEAGNLSAWSSAVP